ncbi:NAD-binding protein [Ramlibacter solisilvae]|uniref:NAD-dependent dehydratase n=1 Tax=Ramlibacter tataouinensis TaxID=94132 RepID=A0A127JQK0_9BURK|nr:NAD-dependent epimerase/dehydratase family protein [Ramlibacter tataouinensis]AMO22271.1 NAD-dependent dehydratase [Ramlibacter tataouinensis]
MPSIQSPYGALPSRFRRERVLIVGCGDVGMRVARELGGRVTLRALSSSPSRVAELRAAGITPLIGNLDEPRSLARLAGLATRLVHLAPPATEHSGAWWLDWRTLSLMRVIARRGRPASCVYASTSGVYGDCGGERVQEFRPLQPRTPRAQRRLDAERLMRHFGRRAARVSLLRVPGIYAADRPGGPRERLLRAHPVLEAADDVYTSHIHADDLARALLAALWRGAPQRIYNICDDTQLKLGDYYDLAADVYGLPRPRRVSRVAAADELPLSVLSFMNESRRLDNSRLKRELRVRLRFPTVGEGLRSAPCR